MTRATSWGWPHKEHDLRGLQFQPGSIMTEYGMDMLKNWVEA